MDGDNVGQCPMHGVAANNSTAWPRSNQEWWPNQLNLKILHQHSVKADPMRGTFNYAEAFKTLDLEALKSDLFALMRTSQEWWPADYGHYGPLFIRMAWHSAGTYRIGDGRGGAGSGTQRFAPLNSWPDNANLDKARLPDLADQAEIRPQAFLGGPDRSCTGNLSRSRIDGLQDVRLRGRSRRRVGTAEETFTGARKETWLGRFKRYSGERAARRAARRGSDGVDLRQSGRAGRSSPDPLGSARDIRETFARMAMNDEETVALIAGGHTFGKTHGAASAPVATSDPEPEAGALDGSHGPRLEEHATGWVTVPMPSPAGLGGDLVCRHRRQWRQFLLRQPVQLRMGTHEEPLSRRHMAVGREERRALPIQTPDAHNAVEDVTFADDADIGPRADRVDPAYLEKISQALSRQRRRNSRTPSRGRGSS